MKKIKILIKKAFYETILVLYVLGSIVGVFGLCAIPLLFIIKIMPFGIYANGFIGIVITLFVLNRIPSNFFDKIPVVLDKPIKYLDKKFEKIEQEELNEYLYRKHGIKFPPKN